MVLLLTFGCKDTAVFENPQIFLIFFKNFYVLRKMRCLCRIKPSGYGSGERRPNQDYRLPPSSRFSPSVNIGTRRKSPSFPHISRFCKFFIFNQLNLFLPIFVTTFVFGIWEIPFWQFIYYKLESERRSGAPTFWFRLSDFLIFYCFLL